MLRKNRKILANIRVDVDVAHERLDELALRIEGAWQLLRVAVDEIQATQATLGIMPHGKNRDVAQRLDYLTQLITAIDETVDGMLARRHIWRIPWKLRKPWTRR